MYPVKGEVYRDTLSKKTDFLESKDAIPNT